MNSTKNSRVMLFIGLFLMITLSCGVLQSTTQTTPTFSPEVVTPALTNTPESYSDNVSETQTASISETDPAMLSVAYVKDGNIWIWRRENPALPLTSSGNITRLVLSTDGKVIAFERKIDDYHSELWAVNSDASGEHLLISVDEFNNFEKEKWLEYAKSLVPYHFDFIPGTHILAYNTRQTFEGPGLALFDDLRLVNTDTPEKLTLLPSGQGGEFVYSPDGQEIAISTSTTISLVHTDGNNRRDVLTYAIVSTYSEYSYYALPVWAADSTSLRVVIPPADPLGAPRQATTIWLIPVDGNGATQLGSIMAAPFGGFENAFSPDFSHIIYTTEVGEIEQNLRDLHLADPNGANDVTSLTNQYIAFSGWAPDSQHFVVIAGAPSGVQLGDLQNNFQPLTEGSDVVVDVTWVDANQLLFAKGVGESWELRLGTLDGKSEIIDTVPGSPPPYDFSYR